VPKQTRILVFTASIAMAASAATAQVAVPGTANIYGAGHATPPAPGGGGGGSLPVLVSLPPGPDRVVQFPSVSGSVDFGPCCAPNGPDGIATSGTVDWPLWDGIAGTSFSTRARYLVGIFLDDSEPADPAPARLVFSDPGFAELAPALRQVFFVGDGRTGSGSGELQGFRAPPGATRLFLGFQDREFATAPPGWYGDNSGTTNVTVEVAAVPVPALGAAGRAWAALLLVGVGALAARLGVRGRAQGRARS
jgi:hypothetical protein